MNDPVERDPVDPELAVAFSSPSPRDAAIHGLYAAHFASRDGVSDVFTCWEHIPRYAVTGPRAAALLERPDQRFIFTYTVDAVRCRVELAPAQIYRRAGAEPESVFPGATEELVEEVLKWLLADQRRAAFASGATRPVCGVRFSINLISDELKMRKRSRSKAEIRRALEVLNRCHLTYSENGVALHRGPIIPSLTQFARGRAVHDDRRTHLAQLPPLLAEAMERIDYLQSNRDRVFALHTSLARSIYKQLIIGWRNASVCHPFRFRYSGLDATGLISCATALAGRRKVAEALDDLVAQGVLSGWEPKPVKAGRRIVDVVYTCAATKAFELEQKAANGRAKASRETIERDPILRAPRARARPALSRGVLASDAAEHFELTPKGDL